MKYIIIIIIFFFFFIFLNITYLNYCFKTKARKEFPMEVLWGRWENYKGQFSILQQIVSLKPDYMNFINIYTNPIITMDNPSLMNVSSAKSVISSLVGQVWNSIDLMETLLILLETDLHKNVLDMFQVASNQSPELLLLGLVQAQPMVIIYNKIIKYLFINIGSLIFFQNIYHVIKWILAMEQKQ